MPVPIQMLQILAGQQIVDQQRARGASAHDDGVTHLDVLQLGSQRASGNLDGQELQTLFVIGAGDGVGAQQVLPSTLRPIMVKVAVGKRSDVSRWWVKEKRRSGPVVDGQHAFFKKALMIRLK